MPFTSRRRTSRSSYATVQKSPSRQKHHVVAGLPFDGMPDRIPIHACGATSPVAMPQRDRWPSELPGDRPLGDVGAEEPGTHRVIQLPSEARMPGSDALERASDLIRDCLAPARRRVTRRPRTVAEAVGGLQLLGDLLDLVACAGGATQIADA